MVLENGLCLTIWLLAHTKWKHFVSHAKCQVNKEELYTIEYRYPDVRYWYILGISVGIRDILVRIRIPGSVPLTYGSGFFGEFKDAKKNIFSYFFLITYGIHRHIIFSLKK
jgi:hypothetical protein